MSPPVRTPPEPDDWRDCLPVFGSSDCQEESSVRCAGRREQLLVVGHAGKERKSFPGGREPKEVVRAQSFSIPGFEDVGRSIEFGPRRDIPKERTGGIPVVGLALGTLLVVQVGEVEVGTLLSFCFLLPGVNCPHAPPNRHNG